LETFKQPRLRAAAVWAFGKIYEDKENRVAADMIDMLVERMSDTTPIPREEPIVRQMAAVALGRIGAQHMVPRIREFYDPAAAHQEVGRACAWALEKLTGHAPPLISTKTVRHVDWFLVPLE
jgi:hypothetical protein